MSKESSNAHVSADDVFDAAVAIARSVVPTNAIGERLNNALEHAQFVLTPWRQRNPVEWAQLNQAASEFAKPYIDELESTKAEFARVKTENAALRDAAERVVKVESYYLPQWRDVVPHIKALGDVLRGAK